MTRTIIPLAAALLAATFGAASAQTTVVVPEAPPAAATTPAPLPPNTTVLPVTPADTAAAEAAARQVRFTCDSGGPFDATYNPGSGNVVLQADGQPRTLTPVEGGFSDGTYRLSGAIAVEGSPKGVSDERVMIFRAGSLDNASATKVEEIIGKNCQPSIAPAG